MKAISTNKLTKYYGKQRGIIDVDLTVEKGDFFGFIGPNGAGKSTLIRTLLGLISQTSGTAEIFGKDINKNKIENLKNIGYLPSEVMYYSGMKVKDILTYSEKLHGKDCKKERDELCERLSLDTGKKVSELSFGNRKKVGIVCALQHKPDLYILDEPTSGLDPLMQKEFYSILKERNQEGATVFLSSHILSEVAKYCSHASVIKEGRLLVSDSVENLGHTGVKRVSLTGLFGQIDTCLIDNIKDIKTENESVSFLYSGKTDYLMKKLSELQFNDITITDPDLEEVFMHYYTKGEEI